MRVPPESAGPGAGPGAGLCRARETSPGHRRSNADWCASAGTGLCCPTHAPAGTACLARTSWGQTFPAAAPAVVCQTLVSDVVSDADGERHGRPSAPRSGQDAAGCLPCQTQGQTAWQTCLTKCLTCGYLVSVALSDALFDRDQGRLPGLHAQCLTHARPV